MSVDRYSGFTMNTGSESIGDSLSHVSLQRADDDEETASRIRESLKNELKMI